MEGLFDGHPVFDDQRVGLHPARDAFVDAFADAAEDAVFDRSQPADHHQIVVALFDVFDDGELSHSKRGLLPIF